MQDFETLVEASAVMEKIDLFLELEADIDCDPIADYVSDARDFAHIENAIENLDSV